MSKGLGRATTFLIMPLPIIRPNTIATPIAAPVRRVFFGMSRIRAKAIQNMPASPNLVMYGIIESKMPLRMVLLTAFSTLWSNEEILEKI